MQDVSGETYTGVSIPSSRHDIQVLGDRMLRPKLKRRYSDLSSGASSKVLNSRP